MSREFEFYILYGSELKMRERLYCDNKDQSYHLNSQWLDVDEQGNIYRMQFQGVLSCDPTGDKEKRK